MLSDSWEGASVNEESAEVTSPCISPYALSAVVTVDLRTPSFQPHSTHAQPHPTS